MSDSPPTDWTTVLPKKRHVAQRSPPTGDADTTHAPRGRSSSRSRSSRGRASFGNLATIHEDGNRTRSRSVGAPPVPFTSGAHKLTLLTPLRAANSSGSNSLATPWSAQFSTDLPAPSPNTRLNSTSLSGTEPQVITDDGFFPSIPPYEELPEQRTPSQRATTILASVLPKRVKEWTMKDFGPLSELHGRSVLASLFTDYSHAIHPNGLTTNQLRLVAQRALRTHPSKLLQLIKDQRKTSDYIRVTLATAYPPPLEDFLCPSGTPDLVANDGLRGRIGDSRLTRGDLLQVILPFLQTYYSSDAGFSDVVRRMSMSEISTLVYTPGAVKQAMLTQRRTFQFEPPCWYSLSRPADHDHMASPDTPASLMGASAQYPSLALMGICASDFCSLSPHAQKTQIITALPLYLDKLVPPARVIEILVQFGATAPEEILPMLLTDRFDMLIGNGTGTHSPQAYRYRMLFKHDNQGGSHCWRGSPSAVLVHWLRAVLPILHVRRLTLTLTLSPHEIHQQDTTPSTDYLPHADDLHRYIYHTLPRHDKFKRFEVWLTSTCPSLGVNFFDDLNDAEFTTYKQTLQLHHIWVQHAEHYLAETIPCVLLTHSISQDLDTLIVAELHARMQQADLAPLAHDPPFYTTWCSVATSDSCHSTLAKCIMVHPTIAPALTDVVMNLPASTEYPVTGDYGFLPIPIPSPMGDEARIHAIMVQSEFSRRLISTQISGLPPTDWFISPAQRVPPSLTARTGDSWSRIIVRGRISQGTDTIQSPVIRLSTDASCTQCTLTAFQEDTTALVQYTRLLFMALSTWAGENFTLTCHVSAAQILLRERATKQASPPSHLMVDVSIRDEIRELRSLILAQAQEISNLASKLDDGKARQFAVHLDEVTTSVTGSITSTLSSASRSAVSQCQSFLASQSSTITSFFTEHTAQLSALYARSNSSESRDTQLHNMIRTYADSVKRREADVPKLDLLRIAVENNTTQITQLVTTLQSPSHLAILDTTPSPNAMEDPPHAQLAVDPPKAEVQGGELTLPITPDEEVRISHTPTDTPLSSIHVSDRSQLSPSTLTLTSTTCTGCDTPGGTLRLCEDCHLFFHPTCLTEEIQSSDLLCRGCTENRHRTPRSNADGGSGDPNSTSSDSSSSTTSSSDDSTSLDPIAGTGPNETAMPLRLSPRGLPPTRSSRLRSQHTPNYSQSTLSFTSKRKSSRINPEGHTST